MISATAALANSYDYNEVARSVFIAIAASYAALDLAGLVSAARNRARLAWLGGGAFAMGIGIWTMHFKGMLAFHLPVPVAYHWPTVLASLLVAVLASAVALYVSSRHKMDPVEAFTGSIFMGAGIAGMHYIGMAAMRLPAITRYSPLLVTCSILLAILFSLVALVMAFGLREETRWSVPRRLASATVMGVAVSAMHYTGMAAATFIPASPPDLSHAVSIPPPGNSGVVLVAVIVLVAATATSSVGRQYAREQLRLVIDTIPQQIMSGPNDGTLDFANAQWRSYTGLTQEELQGRGWQRVVHPDDQEPLLKAVEESRAQGKPYEQEVRRRGADGQYRWFLARGVPLKDSEGRIVRWYGSNTDIQDRKEAENRIRLVIDTAPAMLHSARPDGYVDFFNKRWLEYVGASLEEIEGWRWTNVVHPADVEDVVERWRSSLATGRAFEAEARLRRADEEYRLMLLRKVPLHDEAGSIVKWYGSATDIEDRKRAEEELKRSEQKHRVIVEAASDAVISMDEDGRILLANPATARIFGYDPVELVGKPLTVLMPGFMRKLHEAGFRRYLATAQRHLNWHGTELTALRKNGQEFPVEVSFAEMDSDGHRAFTGFIRDISEKKRADDELRRQKEVFQKIFENIPVMIVLMDHGGRHELVNPEWKRRTGWTLEELRERGLDVFAEAFPDPQYRQLVMDDIAASTGEWTDLKLRVRDGHVVDAAATFVHLSDGSSLFIGRDITERKRAEEALQSSERRQHQIAKQLAAERARLVEAQAVAKVGSWETEWPSLDISWSEQTHRIFETDPSDFHPSRPDFVEFIHPEDRAKVDAAFQASLDKRAPSNVEYRIVMADGRVKVLEEQWRVFHDEQGRPIRLAGTCRDVTERKSAEAELRESEARFRLVADSAPVMIWMAGTDKLCVYFNKPWLDFTGRSIERELGNGWAEGINPEDLGRCLDTYVQSFDRREAFRMVYRLRRHDGEFRWVLDIGVPRFNPDGSFAGYIGSCIDVTERRRAEEQLRQAQENFARVARVVAMGELAAAIAHEVNQPLAAIITNASFCLRHLASANPNAEQLREAISEIVSDGARASTVISRIRALLQKSPPERIAVDMNRMIQEVITLLHGELDRNGVSLRTDLGANLPRVLGDQVLLQQVLINLVMNSIDAMRSLSRTPRELLIKSVKNDNEVSIQVQDSGIGLDPQQAKNIFEPFFTTKSEGIGMGLSIARSIVESHGGRLSVESRAQGALFQFTLPLQ